MFLKRLDIVGFKSFAERIAVDFVPGVTAVVGPNGSGKSNITDAIRWVLGEQSAKSLRGAKMEDVIFAGSDSRKPLNFAEVTLTLDNEDQSLLVDYNEVSVTRRVFRSGDSEFFINKQSCRLKDIVDLFMDSGLGREAFSIISQGKVEEILNNKAEDRRTIFEEAAGVLKYKTRKKKAEGKLIETEENLNRVNDILYELESQVEPLKIQASMAKDYLEQKEALEKVEVAVTVFEIEELHAKWMAMSENVEKHKQNELKLSTLLQGKEAKIEELRDRMSALDESVSDLQNVLLHASEDLEKLEGRKEVLKERKKNASQNKEQLKSNMDELSEKVSNLTNQKQSLQDQVVMLEKEAETLKRHLKEKQAQMNLLSENIGQKIDELKSEYIDVLNEQAAAKNELNFIEQQLNQLVIRNTKQEDDNGKYIAVREEIKLKMVEVQQTLTSVQSDLEAQVHLYREEQRKYEGLKNSYEKQEKTLYQAYQYVQQTKSRKDMLEEMEEGFAGFFQGVKEVLKARGEKLQGIEGAIAELIAVPKEYEVAIETVLGGSMQHVVVRNEQDGRYAIQYLKQNRFGRATFLPLTVMKGRSLANSQMRLIENHPAYVGVGSDLITYDPIYAEVMKNLLGSVVITRDLKGANEMAKLLGYRCRFVTLDGDLVNAGGSMSGGAVKQNSSSLLSRKSELDELKKRLADMEVKAAKLEAKVKELKNDVASKEQKLEHLRKNGESLRLKEQKVKGDLREIEQQEKNMNEMLSLYDLNKKEFVSEKAKMMDRKTSLETLLRELQQNILKLEKEIEQLNEKKNTQTLSKDTLLAEISELKALFAAKNEQLIHTKEKDSLIKNELEENEKKFRYYQEDLQLLASEMSESSSGESKLEEAAREKLRDKSETLSLIASRREERLNMQTTHEDLELETKELKRQHRGLTGIMKDEEVQLNRLDVDLDNRLAHLREEYLLSFEGAREEFPLTMPIDEARKKVKLIKLALEELGTVNLGAIEEYERVSERYVFLIEQKTDLQNAKDTLFQVIDEMDVEMKRRFQQTFEGVRFYFESVFKELFGGGKADLMLTNPGDLLNTGVEIVAQPPGKKLQNLSLLSGGERSLTAIALLFSILKVRPVPFCILDEVEAALDEANVYRFSQYLKRYSRESQFIVITHRKGTMEEADVLYGITMQESGVSKLVSVRFEDTNEFVAQ
ncbi:chromosome segregation protein SMC [Bacillus sp. V3B]|uniref:chromosome segregation protein SMC n=1 Tax=Bacillus sp. V3B TaxID=2804915 RepID=UPI00210C1006|nr:chromosome segregation protein SMC [Bacillus sp. V3B]MCQ6274064.1 chromosome segregation protein SMC [Bacillus sp. V3B]